MLTDLLIRPFEMLLNRGLSQSAAAQALAKEIEGHSLALTIEGTPIDVLLGVSGERISVKPRAEAAADAGIRASPLALGRLLREDAGATVREGAVEMTGDTEVAGRFRDLFKLVMPDLEQELSRLIGEPLAREAGNLARGAADLTDAAGRKAARAASDYLQERSRVLPSRSEIREFAREVDRLVNDVERAQARIAQLKENP